VPNPKTLGIKEAFMKTIALILALGALGISPFLWGGSAEAQTRLPQKEDPCKELRLEIEETGPVDISTWPAARILVGLFCAHQGDPGHQPPTVGVAAPGIQQVPIVMQDHQGPAGTD
jgi:hypothetical protein